jgi:hypothetical protein
VSSFAVHVVAVVVAAAVAAQIFINTTIDIMLVSHTNGTVNHDQTASRQLEFLVLASDTVLRSEKIYKILSNAEDLAILPTHACTVTLRYDCNDK